MAATNFILEAAGKAQGNVVVEREAHVTTTIKLYGNNIVRHVRHDYTNNLGSEYAVLDPCGQATMTTARAMTRALAQLNFTGRVDLQNGGLVFSTLRGDKHSFLRPITINKDGFIIGAI